MARSSWKAGRRRPRARFRYDVFHPACRICTGHGGVGHGRPAGTGSFTRKKLEGRAAIKCWPWAAIGAGERWWGIERGMTESDQEQRGLAPQRRSREKSCGANFFSFLEEKNRKILEIDFSPPYTYLGTWHTTSFGEKMNNCWRCSNLGYN